MFWHGRMSALGIYLKAEELRLAAEFETANVKAHLNGMYTELSIGSVVGNLFRGKNEKPKSTYPKKPLRFKPMTEKELLRQECRLKRRIELNRKAAAICAATEKERKE